MSIPNRCLGRPDWVRVGTGAVKLDLTDTSFSFLIDDAMRDALVSDKPTLSPRVRRD